ncbi:MAG: bifunctional glutamate N-acetyltransferase/amino-acid acetyltransferase ArgJ [Eubacterium sp.]|nr:bifunctional glutamate N-acetyltransferase/amino-acid acetyltransferase ArgJ [Eubacterium sp.]
MQYLDGGVTSPKGFEAACCAAGIKYKDRNDMAMIYSQSPAKTAGTFTTNVVKAAPVLWDKKVTESGNTSNVVVINAGIANACTGEEGFGYCKKTAEAAKEAIKNAKNVDIDAEGVLVASTGVIGMQLPIDKIVNGCKMLSESLDRSREAATNAAKAIMTTDTVQKEVAVSFEVDGKTVTVGGMCKGSGMIHPNMCTMLSFVTSDINISKDLLVKALKEDVKDTYNMISVDGDTSTNDTCIVMANGLAGNNEITDEKSEGYIMFKEALNYVNETLAKKMAGDGEGATALFEVVVNGADTKENAKILAKSVITSNLTKSAIFGHDANWGRILCALGYAGIDFDPEKVELYFESKAGKILIAENGCGVDFDENIATKILSQEEVTAIVNMNMGGDATATAWGCDLTYDYIKINADYRS